MNTFSVEPMPLSAEHLTDDQLDDVLIGDAAPNLATHLSACASCAARLAELETPIASFNAVTLAWSERRSATLPAHISAPQHVGMKRVDMSWLPAAGLTAAAVLVAAVAVPVVRHEQAEHHSAVTATTASKGAPSAVSATPQSAAPAAVSTDGANSSYAPDPAEVASDNQLLAAIDQVLAAPVKVPAGFDPDAPKSAPGRRAHAPVAPATVQD